MGGDSVHNFFIQPTTNRLHIGLVLLECYSDQYPVIRGFVVYRKKRQDYASSGVREINTLSVDFLNCELYRWSVQPYGISYIKAKD